MQALRKSWKTVDHLSSHGKREKAECPGTNELVVCLKTLSVYSVLLLMRAERQQLVPAVHAAMED